MTMEKQKITVRVAGKNYTLVSSDTPEYLRRVAALVDRRLQEMEISTGMPSQQMMALTCFNLADELLKAKDENTELKRRMQALSVRQTSEPGGQTPETEPQQADVNPPAAAPAGDTEGEKPADGARRPRRGK